MDTWRAVKRANEVQRRIRLKRVEKKLEGNESLRKDYERIVVDQVTAE